MTGELKTGTMQKVAISAKKKHDLLQVPTPHAVADWALVKIHVAPMCTEYKDYQSGTINYNLGHEAAGEVVEIAQQGDVAVGDRVIVMPQYPCGTCALCEAGEYIHCQNIIDFEKFSGSAEGSATYAQYILKPSWLLPKIPRDMSYEHASMLCCGLGPTFGAMEKMQVTSSDTVLISGMGPVGLGGIINAIHRGANVIAVAHNPFRRNLAKDLGAHFLIDSYDRNAVQQILRLTADKGVDKAIECAGTASAQRLCIDSTGRNGAIAFVGESGDFDLKISDDLIRNGLTLFGIWHYNINDIPKIMKVARNQADLLDKLITHQFPMNQVDNAWELQLSRQCGKVLLLPWG